MHVCGGSVIQALLNSTGSDYFIARTIKPMGSDLICVAIFVGSRLFNLLKYARLHVV